MPNHHLKRHVQTILRIYSTTRNTNTSSPHKAYPSTHPYPPFKLLIMLLTTNKQWTTSPWAPTYELTGVLERVLFEVFVYIVYVRERSCFYVVCTFQFKIVKNFKLKADVQIGPLRFIQVFATIDFLFLIYPLTLFHPNDVCYRVISLWLKSYE